MGIVFDRTAQGRGDYNTIITSYGDTVRFIEYNLIILRDAIKAIIPGTSNGSIGYYYQILGQECPELGISGYLINNKRGSPEFCADKKDFLKVALTLQSRSWNPPIKGKIPMDVDGRIVNQLLNGFDRWSQKTWFPPFKKEEIKNGCLV